ncbi:MAG: adenosylcobinamide-GDP ribazoletransferase [Methanobacteriaceae archaeon]|nr:adenosylcobinamide-GDP ribazoletransferase [Methanobacteriaceae archaeon]
MQGQNNDDYFKKEKPSIIRSILGLATFSTILPINVYTSIEEMAKVTWFWPVINGVIGLIGSIIAYILATFLNMPPLLNATIIYGFFILINGFNHLDGLIDLGDGMMVHGTPERKLEVMKDPITGVGGISTLFIVGTITIAGIYQILDLQLFGLLIIAEMAGKLGLLTCCISSKAGKEGIGKFFIKSINPINYIVGLIIVIIITALINLPTGIFGVIGGIFGGALAALFGQRHLKMANGDVLGASNELGRLFALIFMIIAISLI